MYVNPVTSQFSVRTFVGICILLALLALFFVQNRVAVSTWWWNTTHTLPEVVLFVSQDTSLGLEMAAYYFDVGWMKKRMILTEQKGYTIVSTRLILQLPGYGTKRVGWHFCVVTTNNH